MSIMISTDVGGLNDEGRFDPSVFELLDLQAREIVTLYWLPEHKVRAFGNLPVAKRLPHTAVYETAATTAVSLAHERTGSIDVDESIAREAVERVEQYIRTFGCDYFISLYGMVTSFENYVALSHYGMIPEETFLVGAWHRPWVDYALDDELLQMCELGTAHVVLRDNTRYVAMTAAGERDYEQLRKVLQDTGFFAQRAQFLRISAFGQLSDYDSIVRTLAPFENTHRKELIEAAGVQRGMRVLELGCGSGSLTFDAGLADIIGPTGALISTDPAAGMLSRARQKAEQRDVDWVEFRQCRAEELPFDRAAFDLVIGMSFLHLTDVPKAVTELRRVTKPGGQVCSYHPLPFPQAVPFLAEWFEPVLRYSRAGLVSASPSMPSAEQVTDAFRSCFTQFVATDTAFINVYNHPEYVVRFFMQAVGIYQNITSVLPWKAQQDILDQLIENGRELCEQYSRDDLTVAYPAQIIVATV